MKCLSLKEILSVFQLLIVIACCAAMALLTFATSFPPDLFLCIYQISLSTTAVICLIFSCSTWYYNSNFKRTRDQVRVFTAHVLWILCIFVGAAGLPFQFVLFTGITLFDFFDDDPSGILNGLFYRIGIYLGLVIVLLLLIVNFTMTCTACRRCRKKRKKNKTRSK